MTAADILITNIRGAALEKLGLEYASMRVHRPDLIWIGGRPKKSIEEFHGIFGSRVARHLVGFLELHYESIIARIQLKSKL